MPKQRTSPPAGDPSSPTVSVSEAIGIPADWTLANVMAGKAGIEAPEKPADEEPLPGEGEGLEAEAAPAEGEEGAAAEEKVEAPAEGEEGAAAEEAPAKPAAPAKPKAGEKPAAKPTAKPAVPAKPGAKPAVPAKPAVAAAPVKPVVPAKPAAPAEEKIKLGDKEYTKAELEALVAAGKPPVVAPKPEEKPAPTPAEIEAQRAEVRRKDREWVKTNSVALDVPEIPEETMDVILGGGKKGIEALNNVLRETSANALLAARKSIFQEVGPILEELRQAQAPLLEAQRQAADDREWNVFAEKFPDLAEDRDLVENASAVLVEKQADRLRGLTMEQFQDEVAAQVHTFKNRFTKPAAAPAPAAAAAPAKPATGAPAKPAAAAPAKPARVAVKPPGANVPAATPAKTTKGADGDKGIIDTLW
jgi:hypothetical protein